MVVADASSAKRHGVLWVQLERTIVVRDGTAVVLSREEEIAHLDVGLWRVGSVRLGQEEVAHRPGRVAEVSSASTPGQT